MPIPGWTLETPGCPCPTLRHSEVIDLRHGLGAGIFKGPLGDSHVQLELTATAIDTLVCVCVCMQNMFNVSHRVLFVVAED